MLEGENEVTTANAGAPSFVQRALRIEWLGQTIASVSWIASVFAYGAPSKTGDWLQLLAASAWLAANIAAISKPDSN